MNIFILDTTPESIARAHCDKHVVKMVLETTQILCTVCNQYNITTPYKSSHIHHPCTVWAGKTLANWLWLKDLGMELAKEYQYRYNKTHKCMKVIESLKTPWLIKGGLTHFALAMPDEYKTDCPIQSYRNYYIGEKVHMLTYTKRAWPNWIP
jgi:hypothetical protein